MNRSYIIAGIITLGVAAWVASGQVGTQTRTEPLAETTRLPTQAAPAAPRVRVIRLSAEPMVNEVVLQGRTAANRIVELRNEVRGRVDAVLVEKGVRVKAGDAIVRLAVDERQHELEQAKTLLVQRQIEYDAARSLSRKGFNSEIELAQARTNFDSARAALRRAELDLANTTVRAPYDGVLDARPVNLGDYLDVGKPVATVVDLDPLKVIGFVSERHVAQLAPGAPAHVRAIGGEERQGTMTYISASADPATRTFRVEIEVPNADHRIADGMTAQIRLPLEQVMAHRVSPAVLTLADDGTVGVKLVDDDSKVRFMPVRILGQTGQGVWLAGLPAEAMVITVGQEFVVSGQQVRAVPAGDVS